MKTNTENDIFDADNFATFDDIEYMIENML